MSRLLSEKRIIDVDTTGGTAGAADYDNGSVVVDSKASAVYVSNGTAWTEIVLGSDITLDTDLASGATDADAASALAAKTYTDDQISALSIPTVIPTVGVQYPTINIASTGGHEIGIITANCGIDTAAILGDFLVVEVYNYTANRFTITDLRTVGITDLSASGSPAAGIDIFPGQKIKFIFDDRETLYT